MSDDIAVIGFSFRLPGDLNNETDFWETLEGGRNLASQWPDTRINLDAFHESNGNRRDKINSRLAHFITEDPGAFDAPFFYLTATEAAAMDPMQRWTLENSYHAFENAGIPIESLKGSQTAVFGVSAGGEFEKMTAKDPDTASRTAMTGNVMNVNPNRVSWYFDLRGPSVTVNSACSSSLVAVHLASQALKVGDASMSLVVGSNLLLSPDITLMETNLGLLGSDGVCHSFDHRANGYSRGEAIIALLLKPVSNALRDGDTIRAVVRATGYNHNGRTPVMTQTDSAAQIKLITSIYENANLDIRSTRYVEAHGTGTAFGDPNEMKALSKVTASYRSADEPVYVGSVKASIGHSEESSGLAGIIKSIIILEKGIIPPQALFERINPNIKGADHAKIPTEKTEWPCEGLRRISVNCFGAGGTNAHVVLDDAYHYLKLQDSIGYHNTVPLPSLEHKRRSSDDTFSILNSASSAVSSEIITVQDGYEEITDTSRVERPPQQSLKLLVWSAANSKSIDKTVEQYKAYYGTKIAGDEMKLQRLAFTLASRRSTMLWKTYAISGANDVDISMATPIRSEPYSNLAFIFTGQGAQYSKMGAELLCFPIFKKTLDDINNILGELGCKWSIIDELQNGKSIDRPEYCHPITCALQIALVELLRSFNISPSIVIGHSSGEVAAAYTIGALSLLSACKVSYYRGQLAGKLIASDAPPGSMLSVNLKYGEVESYLNRSLPEDCAASISVACINSPLNCTLAGPETSIDAAKMKLDEDNVFAQKLNVGLAFHSQAMSTMASEYLALMGCLEAASPSPIPMVSSVIGKPVDQKQLATGQYWIDHLISPVRFCEALTIILEDGPNLGIDPITDLVEVGPHCALRRPIKDTLNELGKQIRYVSVLHRAKPPLQATLELAGHLFSHGYLVSVLTVNQQASDIKGIPPLFDCPKYPFDHSKSYWYESRLSRDYRLRKPAADSLGSRCNDWNPREPRWRNCLSVENLPWEADHVVDGRILHPAAALLVAAIEAAKEYFSAEHAIVGYHFKFAEFMAAIPVGEATEDQTELVIRLLPVKVSDKDDRSLSNISISYYASSKWNECFRCCIQVQSQDEQTDIQANGRATEKQAMEKEVVCQYTQATERCDQLIASKAFYNSLYENGVEYKGVFKMLDDIWWDGHQTAVASVKVSESRYDTSSTIHPVVLDGIFQSMQLANPGARCGLLSPVTPVRIVNAWFSPFGWKSTEKSIRCMKVANPQVANYQAVNIFKEQSIRVLSEEGLVLCDVERMITISRVQTKAPAQQDVLHIIDWKPQLSLLDTQQLHNICHASIIPKDERVTGSHNQKLEYALANVLTKTLKQLRDVDENKITRHFRRYMTWMEHQIEQLPRSQLEYNLEDMELEKLLQEIEFMQPKWKLFSHVARHVKSIITGNTDALEIIYGSGLAEVYYEDMFESACDERFSKLLDLLTHENPALRILEVGAGTGGVTSYVLKYLKDKETRTGTKTFAEYTYTDISPSFFENAQEKWPAFKDRMLFKVLNLERPGIDQGFQPESYDLVVAGCVLHTTDSLEGTLKNVHSLISPGGHLLAIEGVTPDTIRASFPWGLLPGWWRGNEDFRRFCALVKEDQWNLLLKNSGFSGIDLCIQDHKNKESHNLSVILATVKPRSLSHGASTCVRLIIEDFSNKHQLGFAKSFSLELHKSFDVDSEIMAVSEIDAMICNENDVIIFLAEIGQSLLRRLPQRRFESLKALVTKAKKLLWANATNLAESEYPSFYMMQGLLRSLRSEATDKQLISLTIESDAVDLALFLPTLSSIFNAVFLLDSSEVEFIFRDGHIVTGRMIEEVAVNKSLLPVASEGFEMKPWLRGSVLELALGTTGAFDSLYFEEDSSQGQDLGRQEVEIEVKSWMVTNRDILIASGREDGKFGTDCAGIVSRLGPACTGFQVGDRVCMATSGCMRTYARAYEGAVYKIPDSVTFETASSILSNGMEAYYALVEVARLQREDIVLIHSAADALGQTALRIARSRNASVIATVNSNEEKQRLVHDFGIPESHILAHDYLCIEMGVMRLTEGRGADVAIVSPIGHEFHASWNCIAPFGRIISIGKGETDAEPPIVTPTSSKNIAFTKVHLRHIIQSNAPLLSRLLSNVMQLVLKEVLASPQPLKLYPVSQLQQAFSDIRNSDAEQVLIKVNQSDKVLQRQVKEQPWTLDSNATYVVAGGWGGIGRQILSWLADKGAKHLFVPSRSGPSSKAATKLVKELIKRGVHVEAPQCDASSLAALAQALIQSAHTMPVIKGCINAAMILKDNFFQDMTHEQWELSIRSKVEVSINLHQLLPKNLDFFVLLSSVTGINGFPTQVNYAAGSVFQDMLAYYRVSNGQTATSLDLTIVSDAGYYSENETLQSNVTITGKLRVIDLEQLLAVLNIYCDPRRPLPPPSKSGVAVGWTSPASRIFDSADIPEYLNRPLCAPFSHQSSGDTPTAAGEVIVDWAKLFRDEKSASNRCQLVIDALAGKLARIMTIAPEDIEIVKPFANYGVDSLMAVDLRNWLYKEFQARVETTDILGTTTIAELADLIVDRSKMGKE